MRAPASPNAFENVRTTTTPSSMRPDGRLAARVLEVRLVDDERPRLRQRRQVAERVARPAAVREHGARVADVGAGQLGGDAEERVRRLLRDRDGVAGPRERAPAEQEQVVGARAEHDVLRLDAGVRRDRLVDPRIAAVRIRVDLRERAGERARPRARQRQRRHVAVEADDLDRVEPRAPGELLGRRRPRIGLKPAGSVLIAPPPRHGRASPRRRRARARRARRGRARPASAAAPSPA